MLSFGQNMFVISGKFSMILTLRNALLVFWKMNIFLKP
jgi:hypothetical protein